MRMWRINRYGDAKGEILVIGNLTTVIHEYEHTRVENKVVTSSVLPWSWSTLWYVDEEACANYFSDEVEFHG